MQDPTETIHAVPDQLSEEEDSAASALQARITSGLRRDAAMSDIIRDQAALLRLTGEVLSDRLKDAKRIGVFLERAAESVFAPPEQQVDQAAMLQQVVAGIAHLTQMVKAG